MGQKSNPIVLRLQKTNQQWTCCWYHDHNYTRQLLGDLEINQYIQNCYQQIKKTSPLLFIKRDRGEIQIVLYTCTSQTSFSPNNSAKKTYKKTNTINVPGRTSASHAPWKSPLVELLEKPFYRNVSDLYSGPNLRHKAGERKIHKKDSVPSKGFSPVHINIIRNQLISAKIQCHKNSTTVLSLVHTPKERGGMLSHHPLVPLNSALDRGRVKKRKNTPLKNYIESCVDIQSYCRSKLFLIKCASSFQNSLFLASQIVFLLEERVSFRRFKERLIKEVKKERYIKGVRIVCSGRVAARSKKAQKARVESVQWGESSLNAFSEQVDFASKKALTTFGNIGVKVWICYKKIKTPNNTHSNNSTSNLLLAGH